MQMSGHACMETEAFLSLPLCKSKSDSNNDSGYLHI